MKKCTQCALQNIQFGRRKNTFNNSKYLIKTIEIWSPQGPKIDHLNPPPQIPLTADLEPAHYKMQNLCVRKIHLIIASFKISKLKSLMIFIILSFKLSKNL